MSKTIDLTGKRFGRLVVIKRDKNTKAGKAKWICLCDCGKYKSIVGSSLMRGVSQSCGCLHNENLVKYSTKHGETKTRLYKIWQNIKTRCYYSKSQNYKYYGHRGITMCQEWENDFINFRNWAIQNGYNDLLTIDRIDVDGNYEPSNCKWSTKIEQMNNTRKNHYIEYNNQTFTLSQLARKFDINYKVLLSRLTKYNWNIEDALFIPVQGRKEEYYDRKKLTIC